MLARHISRRVLLAAIAAVPVISSNSFAVDRIKADNVDNLDLTTSWVGGVVPTSADVAVWDGTVTGGNNVVLGTDQSYLGIRIANPAGDVTIGAGNTLTLGASGIDMSLATVNLNLQNAVTLGISQTWNVADTRVLTVTGAIGDAAGGFGITKSGNGNLILGAANTYSGATTLNAGTLTLNDASAIGTGVLNINGGTLDSQTGAVLTTNNVQNWNADFAYAGSNTLNLGTGAVTMSAARTVNVAASTLTVGGVVSGPGSLNALDVVKDGAGTLDLANTGTITLRTGGQTVTSNAGNMTVAGVIAGGVGDTLTKVGTGQVTLTGANTYNAGTLVTAGTLAIGASNVLADTGPVTVNGGTFAIGANSDTVGAVTLTSGSITGAAGVLTGTSYSLNTGTVSAILGGAGVNLTKTATGTAIITGNTTYTGTTTIDAGGTLQIGNGAAAGGINGSTAIVDNGVLQYNRTGTTGGNIVNLAMPISGTGSVIINSGRVNLNNATNSFTGGITVMSGAILGLASGAGTHLGAASNILTLSGGTIFLAAGSSAKTIPNPIVLTASTTSSFDPVGSSADNLSGQISGSGSLTKLGGTGLLTFSGTNNSGFSGTYTTNTGASGTDFTNPGAGSANAAWNFQNTTNVRMNGLNNGTINFGALLGTAPITTAANTAVNKANISIGGKNIDSAFSGVISGAGPLGPISLTKVGTGSQTLSGANTFVGLNANNFPITISNGAIIIGVSNATTVSGALGPVANNIQLGNTTGTGNARLLTGGAFTFSNPITVEAGNSGVSTIGGNADAVSTFSGAITAKKNLTVSQVPTTFLNQLNVTGAITANTNPVTVTFAGPGAIAATNAFADGTGNLGVAVTGGTTILSSAGHAYTGATTVNNGQLTLTSTAGLSNTAITVGNAGTLAVKAGTNTVNIGTGATAAQASLTLSPGSTFDMTDGALGTTRVNQTSTTTSNALAVGGASGTAPLLKFEIGGSLNDQLLIANGTASVGATGGSIFLTGLGTLTAPSYTLISTPGGGFSGTGGNGFTLANPSLIIGSTEYNFSLATSTVNSVILTYTSAAVSVDAYWTGTAGSSWNAANWVKTAVGGGAQSIPGVSNNVFLTANSASQFNQTLDADFAVNSLSFTGTGTAAATNAINLGGGNTLTLNANNNFTDASATSYGPGVGLVVQAGSAAHTISTNIALGASQTWQINNSAANALTVSGAISDGGNNRSLTKTGTGTLILSSGSNSYGGGTTVNGGTLQSGAVNALPTGTLLSVNTGTYDLAGFDQTLTGANATTTSLSDGGVGTGTITSSAGTPVLNVANTANFAGTVSGSLSILQNAPGTLKLSGNNTYTGGTTLNNAASTLQVGSNTALGVGALTMTSGKVSSDSATARTLANVLVLNGNSQFGDATNNGALTFSDVNAIDLGGVARTLTVNSPTTIAAPLINGSLTKAGAGTLDLPGAHSYAGNTIVNGGNLNMIGASTLAGNITINSGNVVLGGTSNVTGVIDLTGQLANAFSATGLTVQDNAVVNSAGALRIASNGGGASANFPGPGVILFKDNASVSVASFSFGAGTRVPTGNSVTIQDTAAFNVAGLFTLLNTIGGNGSNSQVNLNGGTLVVGGFNQFAAAGVYGTSVNLNGGILKPNVSNAAFLPVLATGTGGTAGVRVMAGGAKINTDGFDIGIDAPLLSGIANDGGLNKSGLGTLTLNGAGTFLGDTVVSAGTLVTGNPLAIQNSPLFYNNQGGVFSFGAQSAATVGGLKGAQALSLLNESLTPVALTVNVAAAASHTYTGDLSGAGSSLTKSGAGTQVLSGTNTYDGVTAINAGVLSVASASAIGTTGDVTFGGGTLQHTATNTVDYSTRIKNSAAGAVAIDANGQSVNYASAIDATNTGGLRKTGTGTLTLGGANLYTGTTTVNSGKLVTTQGLKTVQPMSIVGTGTANDGVVEIPTTIAAGPVPLSGLTSGVTAISSIAISPNTVTPANFYGKLELHNNDLVVDYGANPTPFNDVLNMVKSGLPLLGFAGDGTGITSAEVQAQTLPGTMLGVIDGATTGGLVTSVSGYAIANPATSVVVKYTWRGDANLDGVVNGSDYALADTGFSGGGTGWFYGDMNYDGVINGSDYALIDTGFSSQTGPLPEPATLSLLGLGAMGMLRRRRRAV